VSHAAGAFPKRWWPVLAFAGVVAGTVWFTFSSQSNPAPQLDHATPGHVTAVRGVPAYARPPGYVDGGYSVADPFLLPLKDPLSLERIRDAYQGAAGRGIQTLRQRLAEGSVPHDQQVLFREFLAQLYLSEGDTGKAAAILEEARQIAASDPGQFQKHVPMLIFLQGIAGLRRGESENCVECIGESACIFPLLPEAVHQHRTGSQQAIRYFTEYLDLYPDDLGVRWLLNLASMTLGEYPDKVPPQHRIPLAPFQSEFDIGRFRDLAPKLGLNRLNMAGGAIMDDFDNDGRLDIVATSWDEAMSMVFYRNRGDGTFEERAEAAGLTNQLGGLHCMQTDYNNDGWLDIYVCRGAWKVPMRPSLLRNNQDGTFTDVTREAGLLHAINSQVGVWADHDNDGWLDLFVGGETVRSRLYHNRGDGTFEEVAEKAGVTNDGRMCKGANWGDFDGDGYPDLFVSNMTGPCRLYRNNRNGTFIDVASDLGVTRPHTAFSCWFWDYDNDGWLDLFVTSYDRTLTDIIKSHLGQPHSVQSCRLYRNRGGHGFEDVTRAVGLDLSMSPMGSNFMDVDNDGFLDFYLGTGDPKYSQLVPNRMFKNVQGQRFADITTSSRTGHLQKGHAIAAGDWDRDGNVDLFAQLGGATPGDRYRNVLFQNPGHDHHWITVKLVGQKTNRAAIGARIKVVVAGESQNAIYRQITSGSSFGANALEQTIGLGKAERITRLEVYWPTSNTTQVFENVPVDAVMAITEFEQGFYQLPAWRRIPVLP
jgi:hypothetical protein